MLSALVNLEGIPHRERRHEAAEDDDSPPGDLEPTARPARWPRESAIVYSAPAATRSRDDSAPTT